MADQCEGCGLPKRTLEQVNSLAPCPGTCPTWIHAAAEAQGVKMGGCGVKAYRKLVAAQAQLSQAQAEIARLDRTVRNSDTTLAALVRQRDADLTKAATEIAALTEAMGAAHSMRFLLPDETFAARDFDAAMAKLKGTT